MVILQCSKCEKQIAWYLSKELPDDWLYYEGWELCEVCAKGFKKFKDDLDKEVESKVKETERRIQEYIQGGK